jgi:transposase InsO family protein
VERLTAFNLRVRPDKCHFGYLALVILGHIFSIQGIKPDPVKLESLRIWPVPKTGNDIERFLGFTNFFREHIPLYANLSAPLDSLRKLKSLANHWTAQHDQVFESMKEILLQAPILIHPDFSKHFHVATDASNVGIGACLYHEFDDKPHFISFASRSLTKAERNYSATKRELLGIVFALKRFHYYLHGRRFTLFTDHKALTYMFTQSNLNPMLSNWLETLLEHDFEIIHRPGILNILPDALSRIYPSQLSSSNPRVKPQINATAHTIDPAVYEQFIKDKIGKNVPPPESRPLLMANVHHEGHFGVELMFKKLWNNNIFWPTMRKDLRETLENCVACQRFNIAQEGYHPLTPITAELPFDHIAIDFAGPFPEAPLHYNASRSSPRYSYILVTIDVCTRFVFLRPCIDTTALSTAQTLWQVFCDFGLPRIIQSDRGTHFVNELITSFARIGGIDHRLVSPYHPRANGLVERTIRTFKATLQKKLLNVPPSHWIQYLPGIQLDLNTRIQAVHGSEPFTLMFARKLNLPLDYSNTEEGSHPVQHREQTIEDLHNLVFPGIREQVKEYNATATKNFAKHNRTSDDLVPDGSIVMAKVLPIPKKKGIPKYHGPYIVIRRTRGGTYQLRDFNHSILTRLYPPSHLKLIHRPSLTIPRAQQEKIQVVRHRQQGNSDQYEYLIYFEDDLGTRQNWVKSSNLMDSDIAAYWSRLSRQSDTRSQGNPSSRLEGGDVRNSNQTSMNSNHSQPNSKKKKTKVKRIHLKLNPNSNTKSINKHATKHSDTSQNIAANTAQLLDENLRHCFRFDHADIAQKYK